MEVIGSKTVVENEKLHTGYTEAMHSLCFAPRTYYSETTDVKFRPVRLDKAPKAGCIDMLEESIRYDGYDMAERLAKILSRLVEVFLDEFINLSRVQHEMACLLAKSNYRQVEKNCWHVPVPMYVGQGLHEEWEKLETDLEDPSTEEPEKYSTNEEIFREDFLADDIRPVYGHLQSAQEEQADKEYLMSVEGCVLRSETRVNRAICDPHNGAPCYDNSTENRLSISTLSFNAHLSKYICCRKHFEAQHQVKLLPLDQTLPTSELIDEHSLIHSGFNYNFGRKRKKVIQNFLDLPPEECEVHTELLEVEDGESLLLMQDLGEDEQELEYGIFPPKDAIDISHRHTYVTTRESPSPRVRTVVRRPRQEPTQVSECLLHKYYIQCFLCS